MPEVALATPATTLLNSCSPLHRLRGPNSQVGADPGTEFEKCLDGHIENIALVIEFSPQPTTDPTGGDTVEKGLLVGVEIDPLLPRRRDRPPEPARLIELILGRRRDSALR